MTAKILYYLLKIAYANDGLSGTPSSGDGLSGTPGTSLENPLKWNDVQSFVNGLISALTPIAVAITAFVILYGAFQMLTSGGDEKKFSTGKKTILYAVVGLGILLLASAIISILTDIVGQVKGNV